MRGPSELKLGGGSQVSQRSIEAQIGVGRWHVVLAAIIIVAVSKQRRSKLHVVSRRW